MKLFHTSNMEIPRPDIHLGRKNADFGWGFYLTPDREFASRWAQENSVINEYEFDDTGLDVHSFTRSPDWFEYIFHNRILKDSLTADVVIGPIANDTIFDTLGIISSGFLSTEEAMELLMVGPEYTQVAVKSEKAAARLRWTGVERIERVDAEILKAERKEYREKFEEVLARLMEE